MEIKELSDIHETFEAYEVYKHCMYMPTFEKYNQQIASYLQDESIKIFACCDNDIIKGIIVILFFEYNQAEILGIAVDTSERGRGIGSYMINTIKDTYALKVINAETDDDAVGFYKKFGFETTRIVKEYDEQKYIRYKCRLVR